MALTKFTGANNTIQGLSDQPNQTDGLTPAQLKLKFDQHAIDNKNFINNTLTTEIEAQFATKTEINNITLGLIPDGSLTNDKLSNEEGQIKSQLTNVINQLKSNPNLLQNGSGELGMQNWTDQSTGKIFLSTTNGDDGSNAFVSTTSSTSSAYAFQSNYIPFSENTPITLSLDMYAALTTGYMYVTVHCYNGSTYLTDVTIIQRTTNTPWSRFKASGTTPANTTQVKIEFGVSDNTTLTTVGWKKIKLEYGNIATIYNSESDISFLMDKHYIASGTYTDSSTSIPAGSNYTKNIPISTLATKGRLIIRGISNINTTIIHFTTTLINAMSFCNSGGTIKMFTGALDSVLSDVGMFGTSIRITSVYITSGNLSITFTNTGGSANTLNITGSIWEVEG